MYRSSSPALCLHGPSAGQYTVSEQSSNFMNSHSALRCPGRHFAERRESAEDGVNIRLFRRQDLFCLVLSDEVVEVAAAVCTERLACVADSWRYSQSLFFVYSLLWRFPHPPFSPLLRPSGLCSFPLSFSVTELTAPLSTRTGHKCPPTSTAVLLSV